MNRNTLFNRKFWKAAPLTFLALMLSLWASAEQYRTEMPLVEVDNYLMKQIRFVFAMLVVMVFLALLILGMLLSKDPSKFSLRWFLNSITGKGSADKSTDHNYDGIVELDNPMPAYLRLIFYGSILFAIVYLFHYHVLETGALQDEEYRMEMAAAELKYQGIELPDDQIIFITDQARLSKAKTLFSENCATCHGEDMGGISGPNLTDKYWLHGGDIKDIYGTITEGVPGKTMISWKKRISSTQRLELASYILSLQGSSPKDPKAPEGTMFGEEATGSDPSLSDDLTSDTLTVDSGSTL